LDLQLAHDTPLLLYCAKDSSPEQVQLVEMVRPPLDGNGILKLVFAILSAVAEAERDRIRERVRDVKRESARP
jgi:DNA invertase Pin-like site-specific DNA recombinase